ncbi:MAG TPA: DNA polymerase Y family protein [Mycobacteriales bacterium]|nr:DNA polymerase Y family protein [Mycobacteriales bacterium]
MPAPPRMLTVWCPDWPVTAARLTAGIDRAEPVAVVTANRVVTCSAAARDLGVRRGMRRRDAQARCPQLAVLPRDDAIEARRFEPVVVAVEAITPGVSVTRPGLVSAGARGAARYFGGDEPLVRVIAAAVGEAVEEFSVGIADGPFAAEQAARRGLVVPAGQSARFLADLPIGVLDDAALVDLLLRLGIRTLGGFAALPAAEVAGRFGPAGVWAHRQAGGCDDRLLGARRPPPDCTLTVELDPPVDRADTVAFSVRSGAERFIAGLAGHGLACTCVELEVLTDHDEVLVRRWRHTGVLTAADVVDRIRWQLEGWLHAATPQRPSAGIVRVRIIPIESVPAGAHQQAIWGGVGAADERAHRGLDRVHSILGHGSVLLPALDGGREPRQRTRLVPWGEEIAPARSPDAPWPGRLPSPAPSVLVDPPRPVAVLDDRGRPVVVTDRGGVPAPPSCLTLSGQPLAITAWAGPWPVDERWWDSTCARRAARLQLVDVHGRAYLVACELGGAEPRWSLEGIYD